MTDAAEPPEDVRQVAAEHAAIGMQLVDDDVAQILEQLRPAGMMRQDARMQHVGIAEHDMRPPANRPARILRRVAVVGEHGDRLVRLLLDRLAQAVQLGQLILRERFRREQIQGARGRVFEDAAQDRRVVAERLAGGRRRHHDDVAIAPHVRERCRLMRVQFADAARDERAPEPIVQLVGKRHGPRRARGQMVYRGHGGGAARGLRLVLGLRRGRPDAQQGLLNRPVLDRRDGCVGGWHRDPRSLSLLAPIAPLAGGRRFSERC